MTKRISPTSAPLQALRHRVTGAIERGEAKVITGLPATKFYATTYCNQAHRLSDGKPINHECYIIPPKALELERSGDVDAAIEVMRHTLLKHNRGVKS